MRPDDLGAHVVRALLDRSPSLEPGRVDEVMFGDANQAGEDNRNVARMAWLLNGLPTSVPGSTINRLCGSSLDAAMQASRGIETGEADVVLVGGVESMSRAPWIMLKPDRAFPAQQQELYSSTLGWRMVNPNMPEQWTISLGASAEKLADIYKVSRDAQDEFALRSHQKAQAAWENGFYGEWVVPVPGTELKRDENIRADTSLEKLGKLKPAFVEDGTVTAGNSSPLNDGAGAALLASEAGTETVGRDPIARIVSRGAAGVDPDVFGIAPVRAAEIALERAGIGWGDVAVVELNEAFASQCLADIGGVARARSRQGESERRCDRAWASAGRVGRSYSRVVGPRATAPWWWIWRGRAVYRRWSGTGSRTGGITSDRGASDRERGPHDL